MFVRVSSYSLLCLLLSRLLLSSLSDVLVQRPRARPRSNSAVVVSPTDSSPSESTDKRSVTPMSQLLSTNTTRIGPDQFLQLVYRSSTAYSADTAHTLRRRRVSFTSILTYLLLWLLNTNLVFYQVFSSVGWANSITGQKLSVCLSVNCYLYSCLPTYQSTLTSPVLPLHEYGTAYRIMSPRLKLW